MERLSLLVVCVCVCVCVCVIMYLSHTMFFCSGVMQAKAVSLMFCRFAHAQIENTLRMRSSPALRTRAFLVSKARRS